MVEKEVAATEQQELYRLFTAAMAAFLRHGPLPPFEIGADDWTALAALARRQSLSAALYDRVATMPMPTAVHTRLQRDGYSTLIKTTAQQAAQQEMAEAFATQEVAHLFFKGAVLRRYYPDPSLRSMGDLDLLIHEDDRERADGVMRSLGFACTEKVSDVWVYARGRCLVEIHAALRLFDRSRQDTLPYDDVWEQTCLESGTTYRFIDEAEAEMTVSHLIAHFCGGGCGLRQLMDVAVLAYAFPTEAFWHTVLARLARHGTDEFARHLLWLCRTWFAAPLADGVCAPLTAAQEETLRARLLDDGTFGADERLFLAQMRCERRAQGERATAARHFCRWLFPSAAMLKARYPYARKHPLLLPAAFVQRLWDGVTKHRRLHQRRLQYTAQHMAALEEEVAFFEEIGL